MPAMAGNIIAEHQDDVRFDGIGALYYEADPVEPHPGIADMRICDKRCREVQILGPVGRRRIVALDLKTERFDADRIGGR